MMTAFWTVALIDCEAASVRLMIQLSTLRICAAFAGALWIGGWNAAGQTPAQSDATEKPWERFAKQKSAANQTVAQSSATNTLKKPEPRIEITGMAKPTGKALMLPDEITIRSGKTYQGVRLQQVYPSEIIISYRRNDGVRDLMNLKLADLPENLQKQYGYNPKKAAEYEAAQKGRAEALSSSSYPSNERQWKDYNDVL